MHYPQCLLTAWPLVLVIIGALGQDSWRVNDLLGALL
jgi:hypothetical protein